MTIERSASPDGIWIATAVRALAADVRRITASEVRLPREVAALSGRITRLREQLRALPQGGLHRWVESLQRQVEGLAGSRAAS